MGDVSFVASEEEEEARTPGGARRPEELINSLLLPRGVPIGPKSSEWWGGWRNQRDAQRYEVGDYILYNFRHRTGRDECGSGRGRLRVS